MKTQNLKNLEFVGLSKKEQEKNMFGATAIEYGIFITMIAIGGALATQ